MKRPILCLLFMFTGLGLSYSQVCIDTVYNGLTLLNKFNFQGSNCLFTVKFCVRKTTEEATVINYAVYSTGQNIIDSLDITGYPVGSVICRLFTFVADCNSSASFIAVGRKANKSICGVVADLISLHIRLLSFNGELEKSGLIHLNWETATESNSSHFIIQESEDGRNFEDIDQVKAAGESTTLHAYSYDLKSNAFSAMPQEHYFRLKMVDRDDSFIYSQIIRVGNKDTHKFSIFPNPAAYTLNIDKDDLQYENLKMVNLQGQELQLNWISEHALNISQLSPGIYFIRYQDEVIRFVKE